jgi:formylglycine-generating enzyme required for sulfatase activity
VTSKFLVLALALALVQGSIAQSDISFEWVTVGDPGNPNDPLAGFQSGNQPLPARGAVPYVYSISKYETTIGQYTAFLNAVAKSDPHGLYNPDLGNLNIIRGISRSGAEGNYVYSVKNVSSISGGLTSANLPITCITYFDAVRFVNWLHNGQGNGSTETGAYTIGEVQTTRVAFSNGVVTLTTAQPHTINVGDWIKVSSVGFDGSFTVTTRTDTTFSYTWTGGVDVPEHERAGSVTSATHKRDARYWIPTENEWYKAAYYDPSPQGPPSHYWKFPWRSDSVDSSRPANFYNGTYAATSRYNIALGYTYLTDVRAFSGTPSYYGTLNQAGNVEEWTEGDSFSGGPHSRGGHWNASTSSPYYSMTSFYFPFLISPANDVELGFRVATIANPPAGGLGNGDKIRFYPRAGHGDRMVGGVFEGSTDRSSYSVLYTITQTPPDGWTEVGANLGDARFLRYRSPDNGQGNVAEIEFYRSGTKVIWAASGTPGSWSGKGNDTFRAAVDGNTSTFFDAPQPNGDYVELDTGSGTPFSTPAGSDRLTDTNSGNVGDYPGGLRIPVSAFQTPSGQYFAGWDGFTSILDDPTRPVTTATMPGVGVDLWLTATFKPLPAGSNFLTVGGGNGSGVYPTGTTVIVSADPAPAGQQFAGWVGDTVILSNPFLAKTTAIIPSMDVTIGATYSTAGPTDKIRFYPRRDHTDRMIGGVFEGTNGDPVTGPYRPIYTVTSNPPLGWSEVSVSLGDERLSDAPQYRYLRYRGPTDSFGNVAEIEFYRNGVKLTGAGFGTPGSWSSQGSTFEKALDGNPGTFFDASINTGAYVGIDTSRAVSTGKIRFYPRRDHTDRMIGGVFEGTNGDPVNGPYTTIYTIESDPSLAWNEVSVDLKDYRYLRYRGPTDSFGNVAEVEFYRNGAKLTGAGFGTPGSWNSQGSTFDKALDGNLNTFFDASINSGAFVGINSEAQ